MNSEKAVLSPVLRQADSNVAFSFRHLFTRYLSMHHLIRNGNKIFGNGRASHLFYLENIHETNGFILVSQ